MSNLIVASFKGEDTADRVLNKLISMEHKDLIDLDDACVVVRDRRGKVTLKQAMSPLRAGLFGGAAGGAMIGALVGLVLLNPLVGAVSGALVGAGAGGLSGALGDFGIDDDFIRQVGTTLELGSSAIFVLQSNARADLILPELRPFGGTIVKTTLTKDQEESLKNALQEIAAPPAP